MNLTKHLFTLSMMAAPFILTAQELKGEMEVEGTYTPEIIRQERLASYPSQPEIILPESSLTYDRNGQPMSYEPFITPMVATDHLTSRSITDNRGYLNAGLGSYLNSNLSAGYRFVDNSGITFGAWLQYNSTSLFHPVNQNNVSNPYRRRYDGKIGIYADRMFEKYGRLSASLAYGIGYFNYYTSVPASAVCKAPYQTVNDVNLRLRWDAIKGSNSLEWNLGAGVRYTGFRSFYLPSLTQYPYGKVKGQRETDINLTGSFRLPWDSGSRIGLDAAFDLLLYDGPDNKTINKSYPAAHLPQNVDNYAKLTLTPYYGFQRGLLNVRLGADVDLCFNAGPEESRYSFIHIAPDVRLDWRKDATGIFLHILGGSELQTLSAMRDLDYYTLPYIITTRPVYSPLDATAGFSFGPFSGFTANISASYKISNHTRLGGWYPFLLSQSSIEDGSIDGHRPDVICTDADLTLRGWSFALDLNYKYDNLLEMSLKGTYQYQRNGHGYFNGFDRPEYTLDAAVRVKPFSPLTLALEYNLRASRTFYYYSNASNSGFTPDFPHDRRQIVVKPASVSAYDVGNLANLNFSAQYALSNAFSLWVRADNLLCRQNVILPGMTSGKISFTGGVSLLF